MSERRYENSPCFTTGCGDANCVCGQIKKSDNSTTTPNQEFAQIVWEIMDEVGNLLITKQLDYGPGNINNAFGGPINGLLVRIGDKFERLKNLFKKDKVIPQHESIEDSFKDLANYAVIGIMIQRGKWPK
jgi:hypothetical protein